MVLDALLRNPKICNCVSKNTGSLIKCCFLTNVVYLATITTLVRITHQNYSKIISETTRKIVKLTTKTSYKTSFITGSCKNDTNISVEYWKLKKKKQNKTKKQLKPKILWRFQNLFNTCS